MHVLQVSKSSFGVANDSCFSPIPSRMMFLLKCIILMPKYVECQMYLSGDNKMALEFLSI